MYKRFIEVIKKNLIFLKYCVIVCVIFILIFEIIVGYEVATLKENIFYSKGNCRVVNMKLALDNQYNILIIKHKLKKDVVHLIGIDQNNILHDVSNNTEMDNKNFSEYEKNAIILFSSNNSFFSNTIGGMSVYYNYRIFFFFKQLFTGFY